MSTATIPAPQSVPAETGERIVVHNVDYPSYVAVADALGERPGLRVTFDGEHLELMTVSLYHEFLKSLVKRLLDMLCWKLRIPTVCGGSVTCRREDVQQGLEPDNCFWIENVEAVRGKRELDLTVDPPPDLAIEIDISRSSLDRQSIYTQLGVPEIWRCDGSTLTIHLADEDGEYREAAASRAFPFLPMDRFAEFLHVDTNTDELSVVDEFVTWLDELNPTRTDG